MDVYGLTGGIGSGKSTVAELLESYGVPVVSADELSRIVVARGSEGLADVVQRFGPGVLDEHGDLDRRKMAAIVFQDPNKRRELEAILHPRIRERFEQVLDALEKAGHEVAVYEVPLLFEKNLQGDMKAVVLVTADEAVRTTRVRARDDVTATEVRARMATQMSEAAKRRKADYVIENNGSLDDLRREVEFLLSRFLRIGGEIETEAAPDPSPVEPSRQETLIPTGHGTPPAVPQGPAPDPGATLPPAGTTSFTPTPRKGGTLPPDPHAPPPTFPAVPGPPHDAPAPVPAAPAPPPLHHTQPVPTVPGPARRHPGEAYPTDPDGESSDSDEP